MYTLRNAVRLGLLAPLLCSCAERASQPAAPLPYNLAGDGGPTLMPVSLPQYNPLLVADQSAVKPPPIEELPTIDFSAEVAQLRGSEAGAPAAAGGASPPRLGGVLNRLKSLIGGRSPSGNASESESSEAGENAADVADSTGSDAAAEEAEKPHKKDAAAKQADDEDAAEGTAAEKPEAEEGDESQDEAEAEASKPPPLRDAARKAMTEVPPNPANRPTQGVEAARKAAVEAAAAALAKLALKLPIDPGRTVGEALSDDVDEPAAQLKLDGARTVAMKWADDDTLEVELEITIADLVKCLARAFEDSDFSGVSALGPEKCLAASGRGAIPESLRTSNRALPGERARQAGEGGGF